LEPSPALAELRRSLANTLTELRQPVWRCRSVDEQLAPIFDAFEGYASTHIEEKAEAWRACHPEAHREEARGPVGRLAEEVIAEIDPTRSLAGVRLPRGKLHIVIEQPSGPVVQSSDPDDDPIPVSTDAANQIYAAHGLWDRELPPPWRHLLRNRGIRARLRRRLEQVLRPKARTIVLGFPNRKQLREACAQIRKEFVIPRRNDKGWHSNAAWAEAICKMFPDRPVTARTLDNYLSGQISAYDSTRKVMAESLGVRLEDLPL
jgi:hypothetical protein